MSHPDTTFTPTRTFGPWAYAPSKLADACVEAGIPAKLYSTDVVSLDTLSCWMMGLFLTDLITSSRPDITLPDIITADGLGMVLCFEEQRLGPGAGFIGQYVLDTHMDETGLAGLAKWLDRVLDACAATVPLIDAARRGA